MRNFSRGFSICKSEIMYFATFVFIPLEFVENLGKGVRFRFVFPFPRSDSFHFVRL